MSENTYDCSGGAPTKPDTCVTTCGNGVLEWDNYEYCDDGNLKVGDGCAKDCIVEDGWDCSGGSLSTKSTCTDICGDGKLFKRNYATYCDDGN